MLELWSLFAGLLAAHGYEATAGVLSAEQYGVPQTRKRAYLVASLDGPAELPAPTHRPYNPRRPGEVREEDRDLLPWVSMAHALGWARDAVTFTNNQTNSGRRPKGISRPTSRPAPTIDSASGSWTVESGARERPMADFPPEWTRKRPATTVLGTPRLSAPRRRDRDPGWRPGEGWPSQSLNAVRVSVEEAAVLQGFRADYPWQGSRSRCFLQIGNAVCPPIARLVVAAAARHSPGRKGER